MSTDAALDREFAYIDYRSSCRNLHTIDQLCRRPAGHKGEHASGFGSTRARWANDDDQMETP